MPKPTPIAQEIRRQVASLISMGRGRNELARQFGISAGVVSKIASEHRLFFAKTGAAVIATQARQIDQWAARVEREEELMQQLFALPKTQRPNGLPTRTFRRLDYALYNVNRHSKHGQRDPVHP